MRFLRLMRGRVDAEEERQGLLLQQQQQPPSSASHHSSHRSLPPDDSTLPSFKVVILKASIHCHGCGRRVKKAIEKLEGVNTYHVDVGEQKVTVIGRVCPSAALECVKKVTKSVEFWGNPPPPPPPAAPPIPPPAKLFCPAQN